VDDVIDAIITTTYSYDGHGNIQSLVVNNDSDNDGKIDSITTTTYETDPWGRVIQRTEAKDSDADGTPETVLPTLSMKSTLKKMLIL